MLLSRILWGKGNENQKALEKAAIKEKAEKEGLKEDEVEIE